MSELHWLADVNHRLEVIIALLVRSVPKDADATSLRNQVQILSELGMRPKDIARTLGRSQTYVGKELASIRKKKGRRR